MNNKLKYFAAVMILSLAIGAVAAEPDPLISLDYKDADINAVLRSLAWSYGLNLVTGTDIKGKITVNLKNVTLSEALDAILTASGYAHVQKGNIIYISSEIGRASCRERVSLNV